MSLTRQQIFDQVAFHLLTQKERAEGARPEIGSFLLECRYRTPAGLKCAIGCLIPDEMYDVGMEGQSIECLVVRFPLLRDLLGDNLLLMSRLQTIHDIYPVYSWHNALTKVGQDFHLDYSIVTNWNGGQNDDHPSQHFIEEEKADESGETTV